MAKKTFSGTSLTENRADNEIDAQSGSGTKDEKTLNLHTNESTKEEKHLVKDLDFTRSTAEIRVEESAPLYPSAIRLTFLIIGIALVVFSMALDNTIIATAIPRITTVFNSLDDVGWYGSSYLLTTTSLQPFFGKIYTYFNIKITYLLAIVIFEVGSIICAMAPSSNALIIGRAVAGVGASGLFSGALIIIGLSVPIRKVPIYISVLSSMYGVASIVGPILGGALTDKASWRWCFWINLPFGGAAFLSILVFFKPQKREVGNLSFKEKIKKIDIVGASLLICGVICLLLALQWGGTTNPWSSSKVWGLLIGFGLIVIIFSTLQWYLDDDATIPPRILFRQRTVLSCAIYAFLMYMGLYIHVYFLPIYFQGGRGATAEQSGIRSIPYLISMSLSTIFVGIIVTKTGQYVPFMWAGAVIFTVGSGLLSTLGVATSSGKWIGYQILTGFGMGTGSQLVYSALQAVLEPLDLPSANAIMMFFITLGGAVSISIGQAIFSNTLSQEIPRHTTGVDVAAIVRGGITSLQDFISADQLQGVRESYTLALDKVLVVPIAVGAAAFVASLFTEWKKIGGGAKEANSD